MELTKGKIEGIKQQLVGYFEDLPYYCRNADIQIENEYLYDFIQENIQDTYHYSNSSGDLDLSSAVSLASEDDRFKNNKFITHILADYISKTNEDPFEDFAQTIKKAISSSEFKETIDNISFIVDEYKAINYLCLSKYTQDMGEDFLQNLIEGEGTLLGIDSIDLLRIAAIKNDGISYKSIDCGERYEKIFPFTDESICLYNENDQTITLITEKELGIDLIRFTIDDGELHGTGSYVNFGRKLNVMGQDFAAEKGIINLIEMYADGSNTKIYKKPETNQDEELKPEEPKRRNKQKP